MQRPFPNGYKFPFGCTGNGYVTAVTAGQSQRFSSGVGIFDWYYLSSPPQIPRFSRVDLESRRLISITTPVVSGLRLEKLLYIIELSRSSSRYFKPLLDPGGGLRIETAVT